ncbi:MAG: DMT family transporter [Ktedonobacteraceae bacterium]
MTNGRRGSTYRLAGYLMIVVATVLFGFNGNLSRLLFDDGVSPITLVELRMVIGGVCLFAILLVGRRQELKIPRRASGWIVGFGFSLALVTYAYFVAISRLPIAIALVIQFSASAWMVLGEAIWRKRMPSAYVLVALGLTFGGILLLTGTWRLSFGGLDSVGLLYANLSVIAYISYLLLGRRVGRDVPPLAGTSFGALVAGAMWLIVQPPWSMPTNTWTPHHLLLILLVGTIGMAIPFTLVLSSLRRIDATRVGIVSMLELVAAGIIAYFWLDQHLDSWQIVGCLCVMVGVTVLQYEKLDVVVDAA